MSKRQRGILLTDRGQEKLEGAIATAQDAEKGGKRFTQAELSERANLSIKTIRKIRDRSTPIDETSVRALFQAFALELEPTDYGLPEATEAEPQACITSQREPRVDLLEAPDASIFYGREAEMLLLRQWVMVDKCRLVALIGMGGMGKTALSVQLVDAVQTEFEYVIWRSLREAPPVEKILEDVVKFLSAQQETELPKSLGDAVTRLVHYLNQSRCLVVLDNAESILEGGTRAGQYRASYEGYGTLIQRLGEARHQSCVVLTSREKPGEVARLEGRNRPVRSYGLQGLEEFAGQEFLKAEGLDETDAQWKQVFDYYSGNPLALKIAANTIQDLFGGNIAEFLAQGSGLFGDIRDLLEQQFERLTKQGQSVMYWLAINREATPIEELKEDILEPLSTQELLEALESLRRRSLVERSEEGFTLQNVVMEYLTDRFVTRVSAEIKTQDFALFNTHALIKATAKNYARETQVRLILNPIVVGIDNLERQAACSLTTIRQKACLHDGYAAGNLLNLLCQSQPEIKQLDLCQLTLRQVYLKGMRLHDINLANTYWIKPALTHPYGIITSMAYSPDGQWLATGSDDATTKLWQMSTGECCQTLAGHTYQINSVTFSPDGQWLATGSSDATIRLWKVSTGECWQVLIGHTSWARSVAFSPDGQWLATGSDDNTIRLWQVGTGECHRTLTGHTSRIRSVSFSPDGQWLATGSDDTTIRLWQVSTGKCHQTFTEHTNWVGSVAFSPDGRWLATGSSDTTIRLWQVNTGECCQTLTGHTNRVSSVAFSPDGQWLATGSTDATIRLWQASTGECHQILTGHTNWISAVAFSPDGQWLATGGADATVCLWQVSTGKCHQTLIGYTNWVDSVAFSPDGQWLATGSSDAIIRLWKISTGECCRSLTGHINRVSSVTFSPDGQWLATGGADATIKLWQASTGECRQILTGHTSWVNSIAFSPNGQWLATGSGDASVRLWKISTGVCHQILTGHTNWISSVAFSSDGRWLATGSGDATVRLWQVSTGECCQIFVGHAHWVNSIAFSPDGRWLATGSGDATVRLWQVSTSKCHQTLVGHTNWISSVAFSPNGQWLATGSGDATARMWQMNTGECHQTLVGHTNWISS
ncbi:MAG: NB-ARC domain-containing protein, partial [Cyanobacteria bacterium J06638_22]